MGERPPKRSQLCACSPTGCPSDGSIRRNSVAATLNTVGPGFGEVGTAGNFLPVSEGGRLILTGVMLAGRLEIFTVIVLLTPAFWRRNIA